LSMISPSLVVASFKAKVYAHSRIFGRQRFCFYEARKTGIPLPTLLLQH
jgi:hypothetical protein